MKMDWKALAGVAGEHALGTASSLFSALIIGLLVAIVLIILYWKLGVFRRPNNKWYDLGVKLYIPYLLGVCLTIGAQYGFYRGVFHAVLATNDAVVGMIYERALGPSMGTPEARQAFLTSVQEKARGSVSMGQAIAATVKETLHKRLGADASLSNRMVSGIADWFIDRYENDIATAVLYGLYSRTNDYVPLHVAGSSVSYHEFKQVTDHLLQLDLTKVEAAIQGNLGVLTHGLLKQQYKNMVNGLLLMGALLALLPVAEWGVYRWVMYRRNRAMIEHGAVVTFAPPDAKGQRSVH